MFISMCISNFYLSHYGQDVLRLKVGHWYGVKFQRLDGQIVGPELKGAFVALGDGEDDVDGAGEFRRIGLGVDEDGAYAVLLDFDFLERQALGDREAFEKIDRGIYLQLHALQTLHAHDGHFVQRDFGGGRIARLVGDGQFEASGLGEFVSGADSPGSAIVGGKGELRLAG